MEKIICIRANATEDVLAYVVVSGDVSPEVIKAAEAEIDKSAELAEGWYEDFDWVEETVAVFEKLGYYARCITPDVVLYV